MKWWIKRKFTLDLSKVKCVHKQTTDVGSANF